MFSDQITCESKRYFADTKLDFNVVDDNTIDITADPAQPILPLLMSLVTIVPSETPMEFVRDPIGTGPYKLTELDGRPADRARAPRRLLGRPRRP